MYIALNRKYIRHHVGAILNIHITFISTSPHMSKTTRFLPLILKDDT